MSIEENTLGKRCFYRGVVDDGSNSCLCVPLPCSQECDGCCASDTQKCHRGGCDMCEPYDYWSYEVEAYGREAEEEMLGRPLFPNEY